MKRNLNDLLYFITVTHEGSLTRAEAKPGGAQPALNQAISTREYRLQILLLTRTTRNVSPINELYS
ncbi:LysR family transcriptional regulator [Enterobacter ludwigii]|jgi:DNA-binding transcriptional LysR family regulator|nr:LysR family transcriptional regulator [Enterobacter ludwigii]